MEKKTYSEKTIVDFIKCLEKSKLIIKGAHKNKAVIDNVKELVEMNEEDAKKVDSASCQMIYGEFTDWIETYNG